MKIRLLLSWFLLFLMSSVYAQTQLFPTPVSSSMQKGSFIVGEKIKINGDGKYANQVTKQLKKQLSSLNLQKVVSSGEIMISLNKEKELKDEGYLLEVSTDRILLQASSEAGLFHGKEALLQMIRFGKGKVRACKVVNYPRFAWRGYMLDESRHFFGKEKVKQYLDLMASLHLNVFHWHLTDEPGWRIEIKRYPKLTSEGSIGNYSNPKAEAAFYTQKDIKEIVAYAADRHIMVLPEFDMPGHATAICRSYPEVSGGGQGKWQHFTFHPCKEETYEMISHIFDELFALFPSPYIHIGADEVHYGNQSWYKDPLIQQFIKDNNLKNEVGMEHYFVRRIADMVAAKGRTIIAWDEAIDAGVTPDKAIIMWWRHDRKNQLKKALEQGYRIILSPRRPMYADFIQFGSHKVGREWGGYNTVELVYEFPEPLMNIIKGHEHQIMGMQMNLWTERVADNKRVDYMTFPRLIAAAEAGWTMPNNKESSLFMQKLPIFLEYLDSLGIYYFNPFDPKSTPEPAGPVKKDDVLQNG